MTVLQVLKVSGAAVLDTPLYTGSVESVESPQEVTVRKVHVTAKTMEYCQENVPKRICQNTHALRFFFFPSCIIF